MEGRSQVDEEDWIGGRGGRGVERSGENNDMMKSLGMKIGRYGYGESSEKKYKFMHNWISVNWIKNQISSNEQWKLYTV